MKVLSLTAPALLALSVFSFSATAHGASPAPHKRTELAKARAGYATHLTASNKTPDAVPAPPPGLLTLVNYPAPLGDFPAYISAPPALNKRYPAIIWLTGGFSNSIGDTPWAPAEADNDQSASAFRDAGIITMYPSLRGGNNNPGYIESFYGEVDDVLAAAKYLAKQPYVDPKRIYLGGHSTGATLALLTDEVTSQFRAVFSFGPVAHAADYGADSLTYDSTDDTENKLRAPILYLGDITSPTYVLEGTQEPCNIGSLNELENASDNPRIHFVPIEDQTHFSELSISTPMVARWIVGDTGPIFRVGGGGGSPVAAKKTKPVKKKVRRH